MKAQQNMSSSTQADIITTTNKRHNDKWTNNVLTSSMNGEHYKCNDCCLKKDETIRELQNTVERLKTCLKNIYELIQKESNDEQKQRTIKMTKCSDNDVCCTTGIRQIKTEIVKYCQKYLASSEVNPSWIQIQDHTEEKENNWIDNQALINEIRNHMRFNGYGNKFDEPIVLINQTVVTRNNHQKYDKLIPPQDYQCLNQHQVIEKYLIKSHRITGLKGQYGVRAKMDIPQATIFGRYIGTEYLQEEYEKKYNKSNQYCVRNLYSFECPLIYIPFHLCNERIQHYYYHPKCIKKTLIIDGFDYLENVLMYINDCRKDISKQKPTSSDTKYWNVSFRTIYVNGWPQVFVMAKRDIQQGEKLAAYYGRSYGRCVDNVEQKYIQQTKIISFINKSLCS